MSLADFWRRSFDRKARSSKPRRRREQYRPGLRCRLAVQPLEARRLLSLSPVGPEFQVNTFTAGNQFTSSMSMDAAGNFVIAWESKGQAGSGYNVYAQRYSAAGTPLSGEFRVNTFTGADQRFPSVAMDADGDFVIAWEGLDSFGRGIFAQRYNAAGVPQNARFAVNTATSGDQTTPKVAIDADGDFVIAWRSGGGIVRQLYNAAGSPQGGQVGAGTGSTFSIAMDADGDFVIARTTNGQDGSSDGIYAGRYNAEGVSQGNEFRVNTFTTGGQRLPSVALDAVGNAVIAWQSDGQDGDGAGVYAQRYDAAGAPLGGEFQVNTLTAGNQGSPNVALDADGDLTIAWHGFGIYARSYNATGVPLESEFRVNTSTTGAESSPGIKLDADGDAVIVWHAADSSGFGTFAQRLIQAADLRINTSTTGNQRFPSVGRDGDGDTFIAWQSYAQDGSGYGVYAQRYSAVGMPLGDEFQVNTFTAGDQKSARVAVAVGGDAVVAWQSHGQDGSLLGVYAQRFNAAGAPLGGEFQVNTFTAGNQESPSVAMDLDGDFVISWMSYDQDGSLRGIYAQRYDAAGVPQGSEFRVNTFTANSQWSPSVAVDANGDFAIAWHSYGQDGSNYGIYAQRYDATGVPLGSEFRVNTFTAGIQAAACVAMDSDGDMIIAWQSRSQDGDDYGVYAQRYNAAGVPQGSEFRVNTFTLNSQSVPSAAIDADGEFIVTWMSFGQEPSLRGVYAQRYNAAGVPQGSEFLVSTFTDNNQSYPTVALDANGDAVIAWQSDGQDGDRYGVYARRFAQSVAGDPDDQFAEAIPVAVGAAASGIISAGSDVDMFSFVVAAPQVLAFDVDVPVIAARGLDSYIRIFDAAGNELASNDNGSGSFPEANELESYRQVELTTAGTYFVGVSSAGNSEYHPLDGSGDKTGLTVGGYTLSITSAPVVARAGPEFQVNTYTANLQAFSTVAMDADGNFVVAWESLDQEAAFTALGIFAQRYNAAGVPQGNEFQVNTHVGSHQEQPSVAMDSDGDFVIAWQSWGFQDGYQFGVFAQRYNAAGVPQGGEFQVNTITAGSQRDPSVAMDAGGDFVIAWDGNGQGDATGVYAQRYNAAGAPQGGEFRVNTFTDNNQGDPSVALDNEGDFVIAWASTGQDGSGSGVYAQRYDAAGAPQGSEFRVNTVTDNFQSAPRVAMDAGGGFVIAWQGADTSSNGIFAQRYNAAGMPQSSEFPVNSFTSNSQWSPSVAMDADGDFIVGWHSYRQDGSLLGVYAQRFNAAGAAQGSEFRVNTVAYHNQSYPSVAMDSDGDAVVAWQSYGQDGSHYGVYAQRLARIVAPAVLIVDNSDATSFGLSGDWTAVTAPGAGRNDNVHTAFGESNLPTDIATWTFTLSDGPGRYRVAATWFTDTDVPDLFTSAARYQVSDPAAGVVRGTTLINQKQFPSDFSDAGSSWEDLGVFDIVGSTLQVMLFSTGDDQTQVVADAIRIERVADLPPGAADGEIQVNTFITSHQAFASVAIDSDGDTVIAWQSDTQDGGGNGVYAQRYNAAGVPQGAEFRVNTFTTSNQEAPSVAMNADGDFVIAWASWTQDGSGTGVYAQRYDAAGVPQGGEFLVNTFTAGNQFAPRVARDADGDFVITWKRFGQDGSGYGVYARSYNSAGVAQGNEFRVNTFTADQQGDPSVAMDAAGDFVIAWHSYLQDGSGWGIYAQAYNAAGVPQGAEFRVNASTTGNQLFPSVALDADGDFVITWQSGDGSQYGVFAQRYNAAGVPQGGEFRVNTFTTAEQEAARVAMDAGGGFLITWMSALADGSLRGIFAQAYNAAGVPQGGEFQVNTFTAGNQVFPSVAVDPDGDAVIAWHSYGQDGSAYGIYARRFTQIGELQVNSFTANHQIHSSVASDAAGNLVITWESFGQDGSGYGVYAQAYNAAGGPEGGEFRVNTVTTDQQGEPRVAMNAGGDFVITWHSLGQDGSGWGVYAQAYNVAGVPQGAEFRVNTFTAGNQLYPSVAMDGAGDFVITWQSNGQDGSGYGVYAQAYNAAGVPQGGELRVNSFTAFNQRLPSVAMDASGEFVIAWESPQDFDGYGIYAQRYSAAGVRLGSEFRVNTFNVDFQVSAGVAMDDDGEFVVVWQSRGQDDSGYGVYAQRYSAAGLPLGGEFRVNTFIAGDQRSPSVALDRDGGFLIAWQSAGQDGSGLGIYAQRYNALGAPQGSEHRVNTFTAGNQADPSIALDADGDAVVSWSSFDQDGSGYGIYAQRLARIDEIVDPNDQISEAVPLAVGATAFATIALGSDVDIYSFTPGGTQTLAFDLDAPAAAAGTLNSYLRLFDAAGNQLALNDNAAGADPEFSPGESLVRFQFTAAGTYYVGVSSSGNAVYSPLDGNGDVAGSTRGDYTLTITLAPSVLPVGPEFRVNTFTSDHQAYSSVASDAGGAFVIAWESFGQDGSGLGVFAQRYNADGMPQGGEFRVNTFIVGDQRLPSVAMDAIGDFVIAWQSLGQDGSGYGVYAQRYNVAGAPQGGEFRVNTFTSSHQDSASVAMDADGDFVIAWRSFDQDGDSTGVYAQRYNAAGVPQGGGFRANTFTTSAQWSPSVAVDADGDFVIAWQSNGQDGSGDEVYARRYNAGGAPQGGELRVNTFTTGHQSNPSVALDANGAFVIAWTSGNQDGDGNGIYSQRYNAAGVPQGTEFRVNTFTSNNQWSPNAAMGAAGDFVIAWHSSSNQDGNSYGVFAQRFNAIGVREGGEFRVNTFTAGNQVFPSVAIDADGDFVIAWHSYGQDGSAYGVYAQRFISSGSSFANTAVETSNSTGGDNPSEASSTLFPLASLSGESLRGGELPNSAVDAAMATVYGNEPDDVALSVGQASRLPEMATAYWNDLDDVATVLAEQAASRDWDGLDDVLATAGPMIRPEDEAIELALSDWL